jgi:hypothetical protein
MRIPQWCSIGVAFFYSASGAGAQVRADPGAVIDGKIAVRITVTLANDQEPYHPVRSLRLRIERPGVRSDSAIATTDESGVATVLLPASGYRLTSVRPYEWQSRWYRWDLPLVVRAGMATVELHARNSSPPGGTPVVAITGRPGATPPSSPTRAPAASVISNPTSAVSDRTTRSTFRLATGSIGFVHTDDDEGMSMSLGIGGVLLRHLVGFVFPVELGIVPNKDSRYYTDTFDNGNSVCRDSETGRFADKSNCGPDFIYAASAEAGFAIATGTHPVYLTGGYRVGAGESAFGAVAIAFQPLNALHWYAKASVGREFTQVVFGGSVPW